MTLATTYDQEWLKTYQDANGEYSNWNGLDPYNVNPYWDVYKTRTNLIKTSSVSMVRQYGTLLTILSFKVLSELNSTGLSLRISRLLLLLAMKQADCR